MVEWCKLEYNTSEFQIPLWSLGESVGEKRDVMYQTFKQETEDIAKVLLVLVEGFSNLNSSIKVIKNFGCILVVYFIISF